MTYVLVILKIFDEILVNAAENRVKDPSMSRIEDWIDFDNNKITVFSDEDGVHVEKDDCEIMFYSLPASYDSKKQYQNHWCEAC